MTNKIQAAIQELAAEDARIFDRPNESATDVQRQIRRNRKVDFDHLSEDYDVYVSEFWNTKSGYTEEENAIAAGHLAEDPEYDNFND